MGRIRLLPFKLTLEMNTFRSREMGFARITFNPVQKWIQLPSCPEQCLFTVSESLPTDSEAHAERGSGWGVAQWYRACRASKGPGFELQHHQKTKNNSDKTAQISHLLLKFRSQRKIQGAPGRGWSGATGTGTGTRTDREAKSRAVQSALAEFTRNTNSTEELERLRLEMTQWVRVTKALVQY